MNIVSFAQAQYSLLAVPSLFTHRSNQMRGVLRTGKGKRSWYSEFVKQVEERCSLSKDQKRKPGVPQVCNRPGTPRSLHSAFQVQKEHSLCRSCSLCLERLSLLFLKRLGTQPPHHTMQYAEK